METLHETWRNFPRGNYCTLPSSRGEDVLQEPSSLRCCEELHRATGPTLSNFLFIPLVLWCRWNTAEDSPFYKASVAALSISMTLKAASYSVNNELPNYLLSALCVGELAFKYLDVSSKPCGPESCPGRITSLLAIKSGLSFLIWKPGARTVTTSKGDHVQTNISIFGKFEKQML